MVGGDGGVAGRVGITVRKGEGNDEFIVSRSHILRHRNALILRGGFCMWCQNFHFDEQCNGVYLADFELGSGERG